VYPTPTTCGHQREGSRVLRSRQEAVKGMGIMGTFLITTRPDARADASILATVTDCCTEKDYAAGKHMAFNTTCKGRPGTYHAAALAGPESPLIPKWESFCRCVKKTAYTQTVTHRRVFHLRSIDGPTAASSSATATSRHLPTLAPRG
jgi:hypothetical protein